MLFRTRISLGLGALLVGACGEPSADATGPPITIFAAASLARPLAVLADSFARRGNARAQIEIGGSMEHARKLTDLRRVPDVLMLVDDDVIAALAPAHIDWYVRYATNRIVVAYGERSRHADVITSDNWWRVLARPGVTVGRADSAAAPAGRHALGVLRRSEVYYRETGLAARLLANAHLRYSRPNATELAALLEVGEVDYILEYESVARQFGFKFVPLPRDLAPAILYGIAVPRLAPHATQGVAFTAFVLSDEGRQILRDASVTLLPVPVAVGTNVPAEIRDRARTLAEAR